MSINMEKLGNIVSKFDAPAAAPTETPAAEASSETSEAGAVVGDLAAAVGVEGVTAEGTEATEAPAAEPAAEQPRDKMAAKFAALAKKEKALRSERANADAAQKAREADIARREAEFEARLKAIEEKESRAAGVKNPIEALKAHGFTFNDATEAMLGNYKEPEIDPVDQKLSPLQQQLAKIEQEKEELRKIVEEERAARQKHEFDQQYRAFIDSVKSEVAKNPDQYEYLGRMDQRGVDMVQETMVAYYQAHKVSLPIARACEMVEEYIENNFVAPVLDTKKVKSRVAPEPKPQAKPQAPQKPKTSSVPAALAAPAATNDDFSHLTGEARRQARMKSIIKKHS